MALTQILGDFPDAVKVSSEVLKIAGRIYPSTTANVSLEATLDDGTIRGRRNPHQPQQASHPVDPPAARARSARCPPRSPPSPKPT